MSRIIIAVLLLAFASDFIVCQYRFAWLDTTNNQRSFYGSVVLRLDAEDGKNYIKEIYNTGTEGTSYTASVWRPEDGLLYGVVDANLSYDKRFTKYNLALRAPFMLDSQRLIGEPYYNVSSSENNVAVRVKNNEVEMIIADSAGLRAFNPVTNETRMISTYKNFTRVSVTSTSLYASDESNFYLVNESDGTFEKIANQSIRFMIPSPDETMFYCSVTNGNVSHDLYMFDPQSKQLSFLASDSAGILLERFAIGPDGLIYGVVADISNKLAYIHRYSATDGRDESFSITVLYGRWYAQYPIAMTFFNLVYEEPLLVGKRHVKEDVAEFNCTYRRYSWTAKAELQVVPTLHAVPNPTEEFVTFAEFKFTELRDETVFIDSIEVPLPRNLDGFVFRFRVKYTGADGWTGYSDEYEDYTGRGIAAQPVVNQLTQPVPQSDNSVSGASRFGTTLFVTLIVHSLFLVQL